MLIPTPKNCDVSVKKAIQLLSTKLDYNAEPVFATVTITDLTASTLIGANASKLLESVTIGTGLDYTRPTLSLSHLGIEALGDAGADEIMFWDESVDACKWLGMGNSVAITDVTLDTIQDIRTSASPEFTGLTLSGLTQGSVLFAGAGGVISQDNDKLFWDATNFRLGIGTTTPNLPLHVESELNNVAKFVSVDNRASIQVSDDDTNTYLGAEAGISWIGHGPAKAATNLNILVNGNVGIGEIVPETLTEWTHIQPYLTLHNSTNEDTDGGRESRLIFKGEQSGGEETTLARIQVSHDGTGDDQLGKYVISVNTGAGLAQALEIGSDLLATFAGAVNITGAISAGSFTGLAIGTNVQAWDAQLDDIAALAVTDGNFIVGDGTNWVAESGATVRTSVGLGTGDSPQFTAVNIGHASDTTITRVSAGVIAVEGTTVMMIGDAPTSHLHDGDTLEHDGVNSSAGSFAFDTGGIVTFNESITMSAGKDLTIAGHIIFNTNNSYIGFTNPRITFNDTGNQAEITGALTVSSTALVSGASVTIGTASTTTGTLVLHDSNSANTITLTVPNISAGSLTFTLPPTDGDNTNVLQTNGSGVLTWVAAGGGNGASTWIALTDTDPANYTGQAGNTVVVNAGEDGLEFGSAPGGAFTSKCSVYRNGVQSVASGSYYKVEFNTEDYDANGEFDNVTNYRFEPDATGYYHISAAIETSTLDNGKRAIVAIYKNGTAWKKGAVILGGTTNAYPVIGADMYLLSTDYVEIFVYHNRGSNLNIGPAGRFTFMDVHRFA